VDPKGRFAVTSPFSSSLLNQSSDDAPRATAPAAPQLPRPTYERSVTHVVAAPQPVYAPQPMPQPVYVQAAPRGGAITGVALALLVVLLGAVALVGGYYATRAASPSVAEAQLTRSAALRQAFQAGRERGVVAGRSDALSAGENASALRASSARQSAYTKAYRRGFRAGKNSYHAPRYTGYGYRAPRYSGFGNIEVASALGTAQNLANVTGAPVDVEIY
jgi:hypothetical protein